MCVNFKKSKKSNVTYDGIAVDKDSGNVAVAQTPCGTPRNLLDSSIDGKWFANPVAVPSHAEAVKNLVSKRDRAPGNGGAYGTAKRVRSVLQEPVPVELPDDPSEWPLYGDEPPPFPPPWPSRALRRKMQRESSHLHPESPLGPLAQKWVHDLQDWYKRLQKHFGFDPSDLPVNLRQNVAKWERRLAYLKPQQPELFNSIINNIKYGHKIPFEKKPKRFFRGRNPPSLAEDKARAWTAILKDLRHGALRPVDLVAEGTPHCVCPVRTADKNDGSARFVHNSRRVNKNVPAAEAKCKLESLLRARNIFLPGGFVVGLDFASGYHCISMHAKDRKFLAFALDEHELPEEAIKWLRTHHPNSYHPKRKCFVFEYLALPFGLSSSCRTFNDLVTALMGFWRRCPLDEAATRVSSYIDDVSGVTDSFDSVRLSCAYLSTFTATNESSCTAGNEAVDPHGIRGCYPWPLAQDPKVRT